MTNKDKIQKPRPINPDYAKLAEMGFALEVFPKKDQQAQLHLIRHGRRFGAWVPFKGGNVRASTIIAAAVHVRPNTHLGIALAELVEITTTYVGFGREGLLDDTKPVRYEQEMMALINNDSASHEEQKKASDRTLAKHYGKETVNE